MKGNIEKKIFHLKEEEDEEVPSLEIPKEDWETLKIIVQRVGGSFRMKVKLGPPYLEEINPLTGRREKIPYTAFEDLVERSMTFNPFLVKNNPRKAKRIAAHEGAHGAISRGEHEIGLSEEQIQKLSSSEYLGFHSFRNIGLEDPRVDNWAPERFPGLGELNKEVYDAQLEEENVQFFTPEVNLIVTKLGRYPRYAEAASELLRFWHKGSYSRELRPEIAKFLRRTQELATKYHKTFPPTDRSLNEEEVIEKAQECFEIYYNDIWPEVKKLVEMDLKIEEQRQMIEEFRKKQKELEQKKKDLEQAKKQGDQQRAEKLQEEIEALERELDPFNELPEDVRRELQEQIDKAIREAAEKLSKEIEEKERQKEEARKRQEELEREIQDLEEKAKSASGEEREKLERQIQEKKAEKLEQEMKQKQAEKELKQIQDALTDIQSGEEMPYPEDKLSDKTKQELEKLFQKLPRSKKEKYQEQARQQLEDFEDAINEEMEGKLNEDKPESHRERREREKAEREAARKSEEARIERERIEKELERIRREKMTPYERARAEVVGLIDDLYYRLRRILKPEEYGGEEAGYQSGQILDISRAMQAEKDVMQKHKLWKRETAPGNKDYRFCHLIDLSSSMAGEKIEETFKGFIVAGEAIDRLEDLTMIIRQAIIGFHNRIFPYKDFQERFTKEVEDRLSTMLVRTKDWGAGTNIYSGILFALEKLKQNLGQTANYLLVYSDGVPNYDIRDELKKLLKEGKEERDKSKIKIGLIWLGETEDEERLQELVREYGYDFGLVMPAVNPENGRSFSQALADLLEDIVENPEKY